jgi:hypothetical protein
MSSQQVVKRKSNNNPIYGVLLNYVTLLLCRKTMDKKEGANVISVETTFSQFLVLCTERIYKEIDC